MPRQLETLFFIPPPEGRTSWRGGDARTRLSHLAGDALPLALFHKNDDGSPKQSRALVRWAGGRECFRIVGVGAAANEAVQAAAMPVARALMSGDRPVRVEMRETRVSCAIQGAPTGYRLARLVVAKSTAEVHAFWNQLDDAGRRERIAGMVRRGIVAQIETLQRLGEGEDLPEPDETLIRLLNVRVLAIGDPAVEYVGSNRSGGARHVDVVDANIQINAVLGGHWNAGWMAHLGYGHIKPVNAYHAPREPKRSELSETDPAHPRVRRAQLSKGKPA